MRRRFFGIRFNAINILFSLLIIICFTGLITLTHYIGRGTFKKPSSANTSKPEQSLITPMHTPASTHIYTTENQHTDSYPFLTISWSPSLTNIFTTAFSIMPEQTPPLPHITKTSIPAATKQTIITAVTPILTPTPTPTQTVFIDNWSYRSENIQLNIQQVQENEVTMFVADVKIKNTSYIRAAFALDKYGNYTEHASAMAQKNNAVFAVNGDYYGSRNDGIIIRNGILYRNVPTRDMLAIYKDGHMDSLDEHTADAQDLLDSGVLHTYSFGPTLVKSGIALTDFSSYPIRVLNPRTGIGQLEPNHFLIIVVDGRISGWSKGMTLNEFAKEFEKRGCSYAYNLDGGYTSTMIFNNRLVNKITGKSVERNISDILYFTEP